MGAALVSMEQVSQGGKLLAVSPSQSHHLEASLRNPLQFSGTWGDWMGQGEEERRLLRREKKEQLSESCE